jgi:hypothetical protein
MTVWHVTVAVLRRFNLSDVYRAHCANFSSAERVPAVLETLERVPPADYNALIIVPEYFH